MKLNKLPQGVFTGSQWKELNSFLKARKAALPAVCVSSTGTANAVMEAAVEAKSPVIILTSFGGGHFNAGKSLPNTPEVWAAGAESIARHVKLMAPHYGASVILATDHCNMDNLPWLELMLEINEEEWSTNGRSLWSGHMADLSASPIEEALPIYKDLLQRHHDLDLVLEYELGETGGIEDGVAGEVSYTTPEEAARIDKILRAISNMYTAAWSFGNAHGASKLEFDLRPNILGDCQSMVQQVSGTGPNDVDLVFHGGSGCTPAQIKAALNHGVIKMNIDTDTQYAYTCKGLVPFVQENIGQLESQIGSPEDPNSNNKKCYDPRKTLRPAEIAMKNRVIQCFKELNSFNLCG